jgi:IMP dehydrogenase
MEDYYKAFTFSDVLIKPMYSEIESRKEVCISSDFDYFKLSLPVISAPMKSICGPKMAIEMHRNGGLGILHRFCSVEKAIEDYKEANDTCCENRYMNTCGVSIGVQEEDKERFSKLYEAGARIFCLDSANGYCKAMKEQISWIKLNTTDAYIIAGNVATPDGARFLTELGANAIRCGIGPGRACMTRRNTGVGIPALYSLMTIYEELKNASPRPRIIADGGIKFGGDFAKALKYSDAVMVGSFIAGTSETPGEVFKDENGQYYKVYMGSASGENKIESGKANEFVEGIAIKVPFRGHVKHILREVKEGLKSAFSYTNSRNIDEFHKNCEFIEITSGGKEESKI